MIETDEDECETKRITPVAQEDMEKADASLSIREKGEFVILTPAKSVSLVPRRLSPNLEDSRQTQVCHRNSRGPRHD